MQAEWYTSMILGKTQPNDSIYVTVQLYSCLIIATNAIVTWPVLVLYHAIVMQTLTMEIEKYLNKKIR